MIAVAALAIGCRAEAGPGGAITPPAGWKPLLDLATAARTAIATDGVTVDTSEAWGEPAIGCYALHLVVHGGPSNADHIADGLKRANVTVTELAKPEGALSFAFSRAPYHGRLRATSGSGSTAALACFWNQREPVVCEAACTTLLGSQP